MDEIKELKELKKYIMNKKKLVLEMAQELIEKNTTTTTLEVKLQLRNKYPNEDWFQDFVSETLDKAQKKQKIEGLSYSDNTRFKTYFIDTVQVNTLANVIHEIKVSRTELVDLIKNSKGKFITVGFVKADGSERFINGQIVKDNFMDDLGYIKFRESNGQKKRVNPRTVFEVKLSGQVYKLK